MWSIVMVAWHEVALESGVVPTKFRISCLKLRISCSDFRNSRRASLMFFMFFTGPSRLSYGNHLAKGYNETEL
jgi:hypothetical protein